MSAWLPTAPCTPAACLEPAGPSVAVPRAVLRLAAVTALVLAGIALCPLGGRLPAGWVRRWCRAVVRAAGVRIRLTGAAPAEGGVLLVANHVSWLDVPLLAAVRPARMLAKSEIRRWPVAGRLAARGGTLFIERDRLRALPETVARIGTALRGGAAVAVFPEGSTWCGRARGHFRRAVFQAALDARAPVQPVRLSYRGAGEGAATAAAFVGDDTLFASLWRVASARGLVAEVEVRPLIPAGRHHDRRTLARAAGEWPAGSNTEWVHFRLKGTRDAYTTTSEERVSMYTGTLLAMSTGTLLAIIIPIVVVLALIALIAMAVSRMRRDRLRKRFGPEYERTVEGSGSRRTAERELRDRERRHDSLEIRPLPPVSRDRYSREWNDVQQEFVDRPQDAVHDADRLVTSLMRERGYPTEGFEQQTRDLSVEHGRTLEHYRAAHEVESLSTQRQATTEQLRSAMVHYRALFDELLSDGGGRAHART